ncbi:unnamed protein product [Symbiodinium sp. CCMP2592]|nr:unnamed protein product [Symbiodinium sp. CCMP2592]
MQGLVKEAGSLGQAAKQLEDHFRTLFSPEVPAEGHQHIQHIMDDLQTTAGEYCVKPFSTHEVDEAIARLKRGKTSGMSGMSSELFLSMWSLQEGKHILLMFFNDLLIDSDHPQEVYDGFVTLIPKVSTVRTCSDIRPINLVEVANKMYCYLLTRRLLSSWPVPGCQNGAIAGGQVLDAMSTAYWAVQQESFTGDYAVWVNADIKSAFDTLQHRDIASYIHKHCLPQFSREALQLLRVVCSPQLAFDWRGHHWTVGQCQGVQQGHSYSAILFAFIIGWVVQVEFDCWDVEGLIHRVGGWGWLFVDDLLLRFANWGTALMLTPRIQDALARVGLRLNLSKTQLFAHSAMLEAGRLLDIPDGHLFTRIDWTAETTYLRKPLRHPQTGESIFSILQPCLQRAAHQGLESLKTVLKGLRWSDPMLAMRLLNRYIGGKWFWFTPLLIPTALCVKEVLAVQATMLIVIMHLFVPDTLKHEIALHLNRLRRRSAHVLITKIPANAWSTIWRLRCWSYLGHVLRRPTSAANRQVFLDFAHTPRPQGGYPNTPLKWLQQQAANAFGIPEPSPMLLPTLAEDRKKWQQAGQSHFNRVAQDEVHSYISDCPWPKWQYALLQVVPWLFSCVLCEHCEGYCLAWIDEEEGPMTIRIQPQCLRQSLCEALALVRMKYRAWVISLSVASRDCDAFLPDLQLAHVDLFQSFGNLLLLAVLNYDAYLRVQQVIA